MPPTSPPTPFVFRNIYPRMRHMMGLGRRLHQFGVGLRTRFSKRPAVSPILPDAYTVCNTTTLDADFDLRCLEGAIPADLDGALFICQCLGSPQAFMVGDTNLVRLDFGPGRVHLTNRLMWTPAALARQLLAGTRHRFDFFGLMFLSPGLGMFSYTEGLYLLPDGRIAVTSDVDRPWVVEPDSLRTVTPLGRRDEWLPMMAGPAGDVMGSLFSAYNNSHVIYCDPLTKETFLVNYQLKQAEGEHPVRLMRWDGASSFESWLVLGEDGQEIEIKQSIHELVFSRDYILLADTAFAAGTEMLTPWVNAPLPNQKTVVYIVDRRELQAGQKTVTARRLEVDQPCIHLLAEYENPADQITVYMLHTPATNTAELLRSDDRDLDGRLFPEHLIGYGTLPVLDLSSVGKHVLNMKRAEVSSSKYISELPYTWGPYLYAYMGRQVQPYSGQDLFVMFKGFARGALPERIFKAYKDSGARQVPLEKMVGGAGLQHNNAICRIATGAFGIQDAYVFPDRVLLYTISCLDSNQAGAPGYVIAGVVRDPAAGEASSGHEYWLFAANNLAQGPLCKLGHPDLNNSTLFHTLYLSQASSQAWNSRPADYQVALRQDYPAAELEKWQPEVRQAFEQVIWPYFDPAQPAAARTAEELARQLAARRVHSPHGREDLIGEEYILNGAEFAERMLAEADRLWRTPGWKTETHKDGILVESKAVCGVFEKAGVLVTRSTGEIAAPAQAAFDMLVSPAGYAVIDPVSKPEDHQRPPMETYPWRPGARLEAATAATNLPMLPVSEFVVLNAIDPARRIFASKSILHPGCPGGSKYSQEAPPAGGRVRALNTFAIQIDPLGPERCRVRCINYADMAGSTPAAINNLINTRFFLPPLYQRIANAMQKKEVKL